MLTIDHHRFDVDLLPSAAASAALTAPAKAHIASALANLSTASVSSVSGCMRICEDISIRLALASDI